MRAYQEWVTGEPQAQSIGFRKLKRLMGHLGYLYFRADGSWYLDVVFCDLRRSLGYSSQDQWMTLNAATLEILAQIDAIAANLADLRLRVAGGAA